MNLVIVGDQVSFSEKDAWISKLIFNLDTSYDKGLWNVKTKE
jgi:hypothetical protein